MDYKVSVIIPTHNRQASLARAIDSVFKQTCQQFEIIIVDDCSSDGTAQYLQALAQTDARIRFIRNEKAGGGSRARNAGITLAQAPWVAFLDDDDTWLPTKLEKQLTALAADPKAVACSASYQIHYPLRIKKIINTPKQITLATLLKSNSLGGASVCICATEVLKKIGGFDAQLRSAQDWDLWIKLREEGMIITSTDVLVNYYVHFNYRISNDMQAKYAGARRFYFKYRKKMNREARKMNVAFLAFIKSRQSKRSIVSRLNYLFIALEHSHSKTSRSYFMSSMPRILLQPFLSRR